MADSLSNAERVAWRKGEGKDREHISEFRVYKSRQS